MSAQNSLGLAPRAMKVLKGAVAAGCISPKEITSMLPPATVRNPSHLELALQRLLVIFRSLGVVVVAVAIKEKLFPPQRRVSSNPHWERRNESDDDIKQLVREFEESLWRESDLLRIYLDDAGGYRRLAEEEEDDLADRVQRNKDLRARNVLVEHNLLFVVSVARRYCGERFDLLDLIQEGNVGLIRAAELYRSQPKAKFISFAVWWIRARIHLALAYGYVIVRIPSNKWSLWLKVARTARHILGQTGRAATIEEIAKHLKVSEREIAEIAVWLERTPVSLDKSYFEDEGEGPTLHERVADSAPSPEAIYEMREDLKEALQRIKAEIRKVQDTLAMLPVSQRGKAIFQKRCGLDGSFRKRTFEEVASEYGFTRQYVWYTVENIWRELPKRKVEVDESRLCALIKALPDLQDRILEMEVI